MVSASGATCAIQSVIAVHGQRFAQPRQVLGGVVHAFAQATKFVGQTVERGVKARDQRRRGVRLGRTLYLVEGRPRHEGLQAPDAFVAAKVQPKAAVAGRKKVRGFKSRRRERAGHDGDVLVDDRREIWVPDAEAPYECPIRRRDQEGLVDEPAAERLDRRVLPKRGNGARPVRRMSCRESTVTTIAKKRGLSNLRAFARLPLEFVRESQADVDFGERHDLGQGRDLLDLDEDAEPGVKVVDGAHASGQRHGSAVKGIAVIEAAGGRFAQRLSATARKLVPNPGAARGVGLECALVQEGELGSHEAGKRRSQESHARLCRGR
jgi:hypothetical protein